jgi:hypothetical protein
MLVAATPTFPRTGGSNHENHQDPVSGDRRLQPLLEGRYPYLPAFLSTGARRGWALKAGLSGASKGGLNLV